MHVYMRGLCFFMITFVSTHFNSTFMSTPTSPILIMRFVLVAGVCIMGIKFFAFFITESNAILSDAIESLINIAAGSFALYSLSVALKPKDIDHPYGHGKIEFISAGFEGGLILIGGVAIMIKAGTDLFHPYQVSSVNLGMILGITAGGLNFILGQILIKTGKRIGSLALVADGKHLQTDTWSSVGLVIGMLAMKLTGLWWIDALLAIIFGLIIIHAGYKLVRRSLAGLMDEADVDVLNKVLQVLSEHRKPNWIDVHNLRILQYGAHYHIDCHVTLPWYNNLKDTHETLKEIEDLLNETFDRRVELFIHPDPCVPNSCSICAVENCVHRTDNFKQKIKWDLPQILSNLKHKLPQ